ncbi:hypothetical protein UM93_14430 [Psychromicrobium lacuslunae]|uniref:Uncharacterized protein n=1 Tax=Psychromicrobium lacuslunae TaxID=1618207 RepID=A0A0D4C1C4_9MICC|nr:hypothetical protein UM93_14430 [Psychromicrobium lacuslunae]
MSKDTCMTLAQILPVLLLALAFEPGSIFRRPPGHKYAWLELPMRLFLALVLFCLVFGEICMVLAVQLGGTNEPIFLVSSFGGLVSALLIIGFSIFNRLSTPSLQRLNYVRKKHGLPPRPETADQNETNHDGEHQPRIGKHARNPD